MARNETAGGAQFTRFFGPVIAAIKQLGGSGRPGEVRDLVARNLKISEQEQSELLESGGSRFDNQVQWARLYLVKAGYLDSSRRGVWSLTDKGRATADITTEQAKYILRQVQGKSSKPQEEIAVDRGSSITPDEEPSSPGSLRDRLLSVLLALSPSGFEHFCQRLLREAGFQEVSVTGRSGDGGIDGIGVLQVNPFVSFKVLFQCKRYKGTVGTEHVRNFGRAMQGRADKGIILTTGSFTADARAEAMRDGALPIELVDGEKIIRMLEELELGLFPKKTYEVDAEFFRDFET